MKRSIILIIIVTLCILLLAVSCKKGNSTNNGSSNDVTQSNTDGIADDDPAGDLSSSAEMADEMTEYKP